MLYKNLYAEIGKLLYAAADIDHVISKQEKEVLQNIVTKELLPYEKQVDSYNTNLAYYSEFEFDFLDEEIADTEAAFNSFIDFVEEHHTAFDKNMKKVCIHIVKELSAAYYGTNKKEKELIKKLVTRLEKIELKK